jgi:hypothetical protein
MTNRGAKNTSIDVKDAKAGQSAKNTSMDAKYVS